MDVNLFNPRILYAGFRPAQDGHIVEKTLITEHILLN